MPYMLYIGIHFLLYCYPVCRRGKIICHEQEITNEIKTEIVAKNTNKLYWFLEKNEIFALHCSQNCSTNHTVDW